jgi:cytochrome c oxidase subunit 2
VIGAAVAASVVVIFGFTLASYFATRGIFDSRPEPLIIQVRGHQWWWEATYKDKSTNRNFLTANELHVPIGQPIRIELAADDVIHSFWAPNLTGKQDLIPGRDNALTFTVDKPGTYRQQCAEFCGLQHAHMAMLIVAEPAEAYQNWRQAQLVEPAAPAQADEQRGRQAFMARPCAACHTIRGTQASGTLGPDLTHIGSRQYIAAGILPTTRGSLAAWIADPQTIKPGNNMPMVPLTADELNDLSAYLASLK